MKVLREGKWHAATEDASYYPKHLKSGSPSQYLLPDPIYPEIMFTEPEPPKIWREQTRGWLFGTPTAIPFMQLNNRIPVLLLSFFTIGLMSCSSVSDSRGNRGSHVMKMVLHEEGSSGKVKLELENVSAVHLLVLMWNMPTSNGELESDVFEVAECSGTVLPYKGILVSRVGVGLRDVLHLQPGEKVTRSIQLADFYDLKKASCFTVRYNSCLQYRAFKNAEEVDEFLKRSGSSLSVEQLSSVDCMESNILKFER